MELDEQIRPSETPGLSATVALQLVTDGPPSVIEMESLFAEARAWGADPDHVVVNCYHRNRYMVEFEVPLRNLAPPFYEVQTYREGGLFKVFVPALDAGGRTVLRHNVEDVAREIIAAHTGRPTEGIAVNVTEIDTNEEENP